MRGPTVGAERLASNKGRRRTPRGIAAPRSQTLGSEASVIGRVILRGLFDIFRRRGCDDKAAPKGI
jgi:hypothetical protein